MAIRIFISTSGQTITSNTNPVTDWIDENLTGADVEFCAYMWPAIDLNNGRPGQGMVISICKGTTALEQADAAPNTDMLPVYHGNKLIADIPPQVKNQINAKLNSYGFKAKPFDVSVTWQDAIANIAREVDPSNINVINYLQFLDPAEFA